MRLEKRGGRACESCALNLERHVGQLPGVRRATASFAGGVMSVHYDDTLISPQDIARRVTGLGVNVGPSAAVIPSKAEPAVPEAALGRARQWLTPQKLQAILTVVTFVTMIAGWLVERYATAAPAWVATTPLQAGARAERRAIPAKGRAAIRPRTSVRFGNSIPTSTRSPSGPVSWAACTGSHGRCRHRSATSAR